MLYQTEAKRQLVEHLFSPNDGWSVTVDLDAMERLVTSDGVRTLDLEGEVLDQTALF